MDIIHLTVSAKDPSVVWRNTQVTDSLSTGDLNYKVFKAEVWKKTEESGYKVKSSDQEPPLPSADELKNELYVQSSIHK